MTTPDIYPELNAIFRRVLDDDGISLSPEMTADEVDGWDSMNHIFLIVEIEKRFAVKFQAAEMEELRNVGELVGLLEGKLAKSG